MNFKPLSEIEESIAKKIVDAAFTVHKKLGPGLLEKLKYVTHQRWYHLSADRQERVIL